jgi:glutaminase
MIDETQSIPRSKPLEHKKTHKKAPTREAKATSKLAASPVQPMADGVSPSSSLVDPFELNGADGQKSLETLRGILESRGIQKDDPRLFELFSQTQICNGISDGTRGLPPVEGYHKLLLDRILSGQLIVPDFAGFSRDIQRIYQEVKPISDGKVADYIPQLGRVPATKFGVSVCTIDGQRLNLGDSQEPFSIQSTCLALEDLGEEIVHNHIGREPSGQSFNEITLDSRRRPHNPLINAGAIMACSLIKANDDPPTRLEYVLKSWERLCGGYRPGFDNLVFLSEKQTADRNFALAYFLRENKAFRTDINISQTLDFYFQCCSITQTTESMAIAAATLAKSGICPLTGERIFSPSVVKNCLSLMYSCGMYDFSGEFAFTIGLPAKSGVGGGLMVVVPNVMGICIWSPPLDALGNSVRGIEFCKKLVETFNFHNYDSLNTGGTPKKDPRLRKNQSLVDGVVSLIWACANGDLLMVQEMIASGVDFNQGDYDGRTPLHLAAAEGHIDIVKLLLRLGANPSPVDRWGGRPLDDALRHDRGLVAQLLKDQTGALATAVSQDDRDVPCSPGN